MKMTVKSDKLVIQNIPYSEKGLKSLERISPADRQVALMSRLWTGFFGTESCRAPKIFQKPDFSLKQRDFWVFL